MIVVNVKENISCIYTSPFKFIDTDIVVEDPNLVPEAPIVFEKLQHERNRRKILGYRFATVSELLLYFSTLNTARGKNIYRYTMETFLRRYNLSRDRDTIVLSDEEKNLLREVGKQIYSSLQKGSYFLMEWDLPLYKKMAL